MNQFPKRGAFGEQEPSRGPWIIMKRFTNSPNFREFFLKMFRTNSIDNKVTVSQVQTARRAFS